MMTLHFISSMSHPLSTLTGLRETKSPFRKRRLTQTDPSTHFCFYVHSTMSLLPDNVEVRFSFKHALYNFRCHELLDCYVNLAGSVLHCYYGITPGYYYVSIVATVCSSSSRFLRWSSCVTSYPRKGFSLTAQTWYFLYRMWLLGIILLFPFFSTFYHFL